MSASQIIGLAACLSPTGNGKCFNNLFILICHSVWHTVLDNKCAHTKLFHLIIWCFHNSKDEFIHGNHCRNELQNENSWNVAKYLQNLTFCDIVYFYVTVCSVETLDKNAWGWISKFYMAFCCCSIWRQINILPYFYIPNKFFKLFCCSVTKSCLTLCDPMDCSTTGFPALHYLLEFAQTYVHWVSYAYQPSHPLLPPFPPPSIFLSFRVFSNELVFGITWQSIGTSASPLVFPMYIQGWFPLRLTNLISLQSKGLSVRQTQINRTQHYLVFKM